VGPTQQQIETITAAFAIFVIPSLMIIGFFLGRAWLKRLEDSGRQADEDNKWMDDNGL